MIHLCTEHLRHLSQIWIGTADPMELEAIVAQKDDSLLTPAEVAALFRVDPKTVTRWAKAGKLSSIRTLGGHRRYRADEVRKFLEGAKQLQD